LPPVVGITSTNGVELAQPYYFDIAPNRDATVTTHLMSKRGVAVDTEFRYLEPDYSGLARLNLMPNGQPAQTKPAGAGPASTAAVMDTGWTAWGESVWA
jgi:LPS-assembly protein